MKTEVFLKIAARIVLLFSLAMAFTYIPEVLPPSFFNDHGTDWGVRHYWFNIMMGALFVLSVIDVIVFIVTLVSKRYPEIKIG